MPKIVMPMSALAVSKLKAVGWHAVGGVSGLNLQIRESQNKNSDGPMPKSWVLRTHIGSKRVPLGLGSYPQISLAEAREAAKRMSDAIRQGIDPRVQRKEVKSLPYQGLSNKQNKSANLHIFYTKSSLNLKSI